MIVACPACRSRYKFDESKLGDRPKVKTRCSKCGGTIEIENPLLGSANGTWIELERIEQQQVGNQQEFRIGSHVLMFIVTEVE
jgi:predicted Zn finger-like uncharacterized protein